MRRWAERAVASGALTVIDLRNGATAAWTLQGDPLLRGSPPAGTPEAIPPYSSRGERRRKLTGSLDDFLITLLDLSRLVRYQTRSGLMS